MPWKKWETGQMGKQPLSGVISINKSSATIAEDVVTEYWIKEGHTHAQIYINTETDDVAIQPSDKSI